MSDSERPDDRPSRRSVLRGVVAAGGAVGLAGCSISTDDGIAVSFDGNGTPTAEVSDTDTPTGTPTDTPAPPFEQDCLGLDPDAIEVQEADGGRYRVTQGDNYILTFEDLSNATKARDIVRHYGFTRQCYVGRPDPPMTYWLVGGAPPVSRDEPAVEDEVCLSLDPDNVEIEEYRDGQYRLLDGNHALLLFDDLSNATRARDVIRHYGFTQQCFVGRPDPPMAYWLRDADD